MFDLFRFIILRPPEPATQDAAIEVGGESPLIGALVAARGANPALPAMRRVADAFVAGPDFLRDPAAQAPGAALFSLFDDLRGGDLDGAHDLDARIRARLGVPASDAIGEANWATLASRVHDSFLASMLSVSGRAETAQFATLIRIMYVVERFAANDAALAAPGGIAAALAKPIVLPKSLLPLPRPTIEEPPPGDGPPADPNQANRDEMNARAEALRNARDELMAIDSRDVVSIPPANIPGPGPHTAALAEQRPAGVAGGATEATAAARQSAGAFGGLARIVNLPVDLRLTAEGRTRISAATHGALRQIGVDLADVALPQALNRLNASLAKIESALPTGANRVRTNIGAIGSTLYPLAGIPDLMRAGRGGVPLPIALPLTHSTVQPIGTADLLVVKQQLVGYEAGEIAHIENILKGELHDRQTRRAETVETTTTTETETTKEEEQDLQTTERFEMRRESEAVASMDGKLRGTSMTSTGFGALVEFDNTKDSPVTGSQQLSEKQASTYGRDVTSRAASKITERIRTEVVTRVLREYEEKIEHRFENQGGANVSGVYQWVDKIMEAQVYKYDQRLLYDIVVPEPAAFLILALASSQSEGREIVKPDPLTITAFDLTDSNYVIYTAQYGVVGVEPPPPIWTTTCKVFYATPAKMSGEPQGLELPLPPGYKAYSGWARFAGVSYQDPPPPKPGDPLVAPQVCWVVSDNGPYSLNVKEANPQYVVNYSLYGAVDLLPISIATYCITQYSVAFGITLQRTDAKFATWQQRTFDSIQQAYSKKVADYEARVANMQASLRVGASGYSSDRKREFERTELKKGCISMLTYQYFDIFDGIEFSYQTDPVTGQSVGYPQPRLPDSEALGKYIRFFEQAFEWEQMMFTYYPYFWGRKDHWMSRVTIDDRDPQFAEFLKAGAARVVLSVRKAFENAVLHFMETGEIWEGGELPNVSSDAYVSLLVELQEREGLPQDGKPYGDAWRVRLPSTLVKLRADDTLPKWKKVGDQWVPDEGP